MDAVGSTTDLLRFLVVLLFSKYVVNIMIAVANETATRFDQFGTRDNDDKNNDHVLNKKNKKIIDETRT